MYYVILSILKDSTIKQITIFSNDSTHLCPALCIQQLLTVPARRSILNRQYTWQGQWASIGIKYTPLSIKTLHIYHDELMYIGLYHKRISMILATITSCNGEPADLHPNAFLRTLCLATSTLQNFRHAQSGRSNNQSNHVQRPLTTSSSCIMAEPHSRERPSASSSELLEVPEWLHSNGIEYFTTPHLPGFQADIKTWYPCMQGRTLGSSYMSYMHMDQV